MKYVENNWESFSNRVGGTWWYWHCVSHHIALSRSYSRLFTQYLRKDMNILDLGAGRLFYRSTLKKYVREYRSLDYQKTHTDIDFVASATETGLENDSFDAVFCSQTLEHVPEPTKAFQEIHRILRSGGIAIISVPFFMYLHNEPYDYYRYTKHALTRLAEQSGFTIIEMREVGGFFGLIGSISAMMIVGLTWNMPLVNWLFVLVNTGLQYVFLGLDMLIPNSKIFPSNYLLTLRK